MLSLLTVLGQVIPGGRESPFCAAGLRQCRAWNPITSEAMLALWHQTRSMQNATADVYQQPAPQFGDCRGVHWWMARLTRGSGDNTGITDNRQSGEQRRERGVTWGMRVSNDGLVMEKASIGSLGCTAVVTGLLRCHSDTVEVKASLLASSTARWSIGSSRSCLSWS